VTAPEEIPHRRRRLPPRPLVVSKRLHDLGSVPEPRRGGMERVIGIDAHDTTEVLLIRHGHIPASNAQQDAPLTETGREQAAVLAAYLAREKPLDAVFSSPLRRCLETAEAIAGAQSLGVTTNPDLRELDISLPPDTSLREAMGDHAWAKYREKAQHTRKWDDENPYYEKSASIRARARRAVDQAIAGHRGGRVAVVTHSPILNAYIAEVLGCEIDIVYQPRVASISIVWARDDLRTLRVLNSTAPFGTL
jgi:broad specificity phosphatase PhoE